jgi:predicted dehydrogenase
MTGPGADAVDADWRLTGTEGRIDIHYFGDGNQSLRIVPDDGPARRETYEPVSDRIEAAIQSVVDALGTETEPAISATNALTATAIIFAGYESVRRRGRVECPPDVDDHPLEAMVDSGALEPSDGTE